ncbi:NTF2 fold immunity protein [Pseudomonas silesiensis]|uniref:NTF2 fold immunity protein n=1 Tax=Pseudomonas silesiensis TaxID=1853130 RepID=UPI0030D265D5
MTDKASLGALQFVNGFFIEMNLWEVEFFAARKKNLASGRDDPELKNHYGEKLEDVLNRFALKDKSNFGRLIDLGCVNPPTYDPKTDVIDIISEGKNEVVVGVQQTVGAEVTSRITMIYKVGRWVIKKKESMTYDDKWKRAPL